MSVVKYELPGGMFTLIEERDLPLMSKYRWGAKLAVSGDGVARRHYVTARKGGAMLYLHRLIVAPEPGYMVDHANGDGLDNRRCNLRACSASQNSANQVRVIPPRSGFRGVSQRKDRWSAKIMVRRKRISLGCFDSALVAAKAYDAAALREFGEFAVLNFPEAAERLNRWADEATARAESIRCGPLFAGDKA